MRIVYWLMAWLLAGQVFADTLFNAQGYRDKHYRRPTPATIDVAQTLTPQQLHQLIASDKPLLIDVLSVVVRPESAEFDFAWLPNEVRMNIPGSTWLPNVGYGKLDKRMQDYFAGNLHRLTQGNKNQALVFYCVEGCWMSWNAVKRAHNLGYTNLYWYPAGTDGWQQAGYKLAEATPYPISEFADPTSGQQQKTFFTTGDVDLQSILTQAQSKNRLMMLFFESETCPFCQRMHRVVLNQQSVTQAAHTDFIPVNIYTDKDNPMNDFAGQPINQRTFSRQLGVAQTPTILFLDSDQQILHKHTGLIATPDEFNRLLQFVHSGAFTEQSWRVYKRH